MAKRRKLSKKRRNPTKARKRILTGQSQSRRRRVWSGKPAKRRKILVVKKRKKIKAKKVTKKKVVRKTARKIVRKTSRKKKKPAYAKATARRGKINKKSTPRFARIGESKKKIKKSESPQETFSAQSLFRAKIKVIGVGGGGGSIVSEIGRSLKKATFVIADTDIRALKKRSGIKYFWFGQDLTHGLGTGVNVDLAKQAAELAKEKISSYFKDQDIVIFVASLGGGLGSGATQVFADAAREFGGITFGIFTMPFKFEGKNKQRIAQNALKALRRSLNVSLVIPNEKIFKVIDSSTPITTAFSTVNKSLIESLESLIDLIYNPGIINIDFADLRTILRGRGNSAFLNTIEESGKNRVEKICENIFKNPLLQSSGFEAERILFNISGAEGLSMFEVEKISSHIANLNPKAKIIFGISKNSKLKNKIKTTILMTGTPPGFHAEEKEPIKEEKPVRHNAAALGGKKKKETRLRQSSGEAREKPQKNEVKPVSFIPVFEVPVATVPIVEESAKKAIRRSGLEIKKAEELQEKKRIDQEKEWETPAFLRRIKIKG